MLQGIIDSDSEFVGPNFNGNEGPGHFWRSRSFIWMIPSVPARSRNVGQYIRAYFWYTEFGYRYVILTNWTKTFLALRNQLEISVNHCYNHITNG